MTGSRADVPRPGPLKPSQGSFPSSRGRLAWVLYLAFFLGAAACSRGERRPDAPKPQPLPDLRESATKAWLAELASGDHERTRVAAAKLAGSDGDDPELARRVVDVLERACTDLAETGVRARSAPWLRTGLAALRAGRPVAPEGDYCVAGALLLSLGDAGLEALLEQVPGDGQLRESKGEALVWVLGRYWDPRVSARARGGLLRALTSARPAIREEAAAAFARRASPQTVEHLVAALKDPSASVRATAAAALVTYGREKAPGAKGQDPVGLVRALARAVRDPSTDVRRAAMASLAGCAPTSSATASVLIQALASPASDTRAAACGVCATLASAYGDRALGAPSAEPWDPNTIAGLVAALHRNLESEATASAAAEALVSFAFAGSEEALGITRAALSTPELAGEGAALLEVLARVTTERSRRSWRVRSACLPGLKARAEASRYAAARCIAGAERRAFPGTVALEAALKDESGLVRTGAAVALAGIGSRAHHAVPALAAQLRDTDYRAREAAAVALGRMGPHAEPAIGALIEAFHDERCGATTGLPCPVRRAAVRAFRGIGEVAEPALRQALQSTAPGISEGAREALRHLRGAAGGLRVIKQGGGAR